MNLRLLVCGILGGFVVALTLSLPLYIVLPAFFCPGWATLHPLLGWIGYFLTVLAVLGIGYFAASWGWASTTGQCVRSGLLAGLLAGIVAYPLIGAPAAAVASQAPIYQLGSHMPTHHAEAMRVFGECVVRAGWYPYVVFWGMLLLIGGLGAAGGALAAWSGSRRWGLVPPGTADEGCDASIAIMFVASLDLIAILGPLSDNRDHLLNAQLREGFVLSLPIRGIVDWPVSTHLLVLAAATFFCGRWCAARWLHPVAGVRKIAVLGSILMALLPCAVLALILRVSPGMFADPIFELGAALWVGVVLYWLMRVGRPTAGALWAPAPPSPGFRDRLMINAGFLGALVPALMMLGGLSQALALALGVMSWTGSLFRTNVPGPANAVGLIAGAVFAFPATGEMPLPPTYPPVGAVPNEIVSIQQIYVCHFLSSLYLALFWIILAALHAGLVMAWQKVRRGTQSQPTVPGAVP